MGNLSLPLVDYRIEEITGTSIRLAIDVSHYTSIYIREANLPYRTLYSGSGDGGDITIGGLFWDSPYDWEIMGRVGNDIVTGKNPVRFTTQPRKKPTPPPYLGKFEHTINSVLLHWGPGTVDDGKVLYRVRRDELVLEETEDTAYRDLTPEQGRTYVYSVCTLDDQYNESERTTLTLRFDDVTPPTEISDLRTTALSLQVLWEPAHDSSGRIKYHVYLDGDHKGTTEETAFSITEMETGKRYQICVEAEDASGNKSEQVCTSYPPIGIPLKRKQ